MDSAALYMEPIMRARDHPPFTYVEYYNAQANFHGRTQADVNASSAMCLWHVKDIIDWGKTNQMND